MNQKPTPDYEKILSDSGMPTTEKEIRTEFNRIVDEEGYATNTSSMSPFWRVMNILIEKPVMWLKDALVNVVLKNTFLVTASGKFVDLFAWAVNLERKGAQPVNGLITFTKTDINRAVIIPAGTVVQTERLNGEIYRLKTQQEVTITAGIAKLDIPVIGEFSGNSYNLAPGYYRILANDINGIASVVNNEDWILSPGANEESDDELRARVRNQFNLPSQYHIDAVYRSLIAKIVGLSTDRIFFLHDAPRGAGTANVYLLLDAGTPAQEFIDAVNDYVMVQGNHGHGDDVLCLPLPETKHDLKADLIFYSSAHLNTEKKSQMMHEIENMIRCAFRENTAYDIQKTWPHSLFSMSVLTQEIHNQFPKLESIVFSLDDIKSELSVPRLNSLVIHEVA
ncbi:putative phage protein gp47/JayE [Providencia alcalifaciens]|nr:putative phage protein gp47/JayE [Providencia alcalifaciens]